MKKEDDAYQRMFADFPGHLRKSGQSFTEEVYVLAFTRGGDSVYLQQYSPSLGEPRLYNGQLSTAWRSESKEEAEKQLAICEKDPYSMGLLEIVQKTMTRPA